MNTRKFFLVWNPLGSNPKYQHAQASAATKEAERLARENPGHAFYVLEAKSVTTKQDVVTTQLEDDGIPF